MMSVAATRSAKFGILAICGTLALALGGCASREDVAMANANADRANTTANQALTAANTATQTANAAKTAADQAVATANQAMQAA